MMAKNFHTGLGLELTRSLPYIIMSFIRDSIISFEQARKKASTLAIEISRTILIIFKIFVDNFTLSDTGTLLL